METTIVGLYRDYYIGFSCFLEVPLKGHVGFRVCDMAGI